MNTKGKGVTFEQSGLDAATWNHVVTTDQKAKARAEAMSEVAWPYGADITGWVFTVYLYPNMPMYEEALTVARLLKARLAPGCYVGRHGMADRNPKHLPFMHSFPCIVVDLPDGTTVGLNFRKESGKNPGDPLVPEDAFAVGGMFDPTVILAKAGTLKAKKAASVARIEADGLEIKEALDALDVDKSMPVAVKNALRKILVDKGRANTRVLGLKKSGPQG